MVQPLMSKAATVVFHVGAHKTATTHLQHSIIAQRMPLWDRGVRTYLPPHLRGAGQSLEQRFDLPINRDVADTGPGVAQVRADFIGRAQRVLISEENFIGVLQTRAGRVRLPLYPRARQRLDVLIAALAPDAGIDLCLGIRDPAGFLNSAYCQVLLGGHATAPDRFKMRHPLGAVDWVELVGRLRSTAGVNAVTVWRQEDYTTLFPTICTTLLGLDGAMVTPLGDRIHAGLSAMAVARTLEDRAGDKTVGDDDGARAASARLTWPIGADMPAFDAFSPDEHALSAEFYATQTDAIAALPGVTLLRV